MKDDSRILLTGASGALGSQLCQVLSAHHEVFVLGRKQGISGNPNFIKLDGVPFDLPNIESRLKNLNIKVIIHLAAQTTVWRSWQSPAEDLLANAVFTVQMGELAAALNVSQFIFFSSEAIFGDLEYPTECSTPKPSNPYGLSKHTAERYLENLYSRHMDLRIIRPSFVVSSEMTRNPIYDLLVAMQMGLQKFESPFTADSVFNFVCPIQIANQVVKIISGGNDAKVLHCVGTEADLEDTYNELIRITNTGIDISWGDRYRVAALRSKELPHTTKFTAEFERNIRGWLQIQEKNVR